jgi:hypothetical protein
MKCINCYHEFEASNYCPGCGQKNDEHRLTMSHLAHELNHAITHTDKGILLLIKKLFLYPGVVAREYVHGKRKRYFNPLSFVVVTTAISAYISFEAGYYEALGELNNGPSKSKVYSEMMQIVVNNSKILELLLIFPLASIASWLLFMRRGYNLAENFVLTAFIFGEINVIKSLTCIPLFVATSIPVGSIDQAFHIFTILYFTVAYRQFFQQNVALTILKSVIVMILYIVFYWVLLFGFIMLRNLIFH